MAEVNHFYSEQDALQTHTGDTLFVDVPGTVILGSSLAANTKYLIIAKAGFGGNNNSGTFGLSVETPEDTNIQAISRTRLEPQHTSSGSLEHYFFVHSYTTSGTPTDIQFQMRTFTSGDTVRCDQLVLMLLDLDDLGASNYFEDLHADDGVEYTTTPTDAAALAAADLGTTEEWLLLGYQRTDISSTSRSYLIRLRGANDASTQSTLQTHNHEGEDGRERQMAGFCARHKAVTSDVAAAIQVSEENADANHSNDGGYLIALKVSAFADFEFDYTPGSINITNSETTLATIPNYTPSSATNHLILGRCNDATTNGNSRVTQYVEDGAGTNLFAGDDGMQQGQGNDPTDQQSVGCFLRESLPASQDTFDLQATRIAADSNRDFENRWLLMLNMEKAAVAGQPTTTRTWGTPTGAGKKNRAGGVHGGLI